MTNSLDSVLAQAALIEGSGDDLLDKEWAWGEDVFAAACYWVGNERLIECAPRKIHKVAEDFLRSEQGIGSGGLRLNLPLREADLIAELAEQAKAAFAVSELVTTLGVEEFVNRMCRTQDFLLLVDHDENPELAEI